MLTTIVLGFYVVCNTQGVCDQRSGLFLTPQQCETASALALESLHKHNSSAPPNKRINLVVMECLELDKPTSGIQS